MNRISMHQKRMHIPVIYQVAVEILTQQNITVVVVVFVAVAVAVAVAVSYCLDGRNRISTI
jgi:hypothetical protein